MKFYFGNSWTNDYKAIYLFDIRINWYKDDKELIISFSLLGFGLTLIIY